MSINEMDRKVSTYFDLLAQIEQLQAEADAIKDGLKAVMVERSTEELEGNGWRATWHNTNSYRFNNKAFKAAMPELYNQYTIKTTGTRFTLNPISA